MATNNDGHLLDTSGNVVVDFVWGNIPVQPNDERAASVSQIGGGSGDYAWAATTKVASARLDAALSNHAAVEAGWAAYPLYYPAAGNYIVTQVSGDGTTVTYQSQNFLSAGDSVNITGCNTFNLSAATVASATRDYFTVTNSTTGSLININNGKVEPVTALTNADGAGLGYIVVPNVIGLTTALALDALKDAGYEAGSITTASGATNAVSTITAVARTGTTATITSSGAGAKYPVGAKITVASLVSPNDVLNGTYTVTAVATNTVSYTTSTSGTLSTSGLSVAGLSGVEATIKTQSTAANAATVATTATITVTPYAVLS
jgi:hypothetical protein